LYVVTPLVETGGLAETYDRIQGLIRRMPQPFEVGLLDVKAVGPHETVGAALLAIPQRPTRRKLIRFDGPRLGWREIEVAYLYPNLAAAAAKTE
jgi:hypothetical protein